MEKFLESLLKLFFTILEVISKLVITMVLIYFFSRVACNAFWDVTEGRLAKRELIEGVRMLIKETKNENQEP